VRTVRGGDSVTGGGDRPKVVVGRRRRAAPERGFVAVAVCRRQLPADGGRRAAAGSGSTGPSVRQAASTPADSSVRRLQRIIRQRGQARRSTSDGHLHHPAGNEVAVRRPYTPLPSNRTSSELW